VRPLVPLLRLVRGQVDAREVSIVGGPTPFVTDEGEHGVVIAIRGELDGLVMQRDLGLVIGDEFGATISGVTVEARYFERTSAHVFELARRFPMWLGIRRRMVLYPSPPGWHGVARGLEAHWYAPGFPRDPVRMIISPAVPSAGARADDVLAALCDERAPWTASSRTTPAGLTFHYRTQLAPDRATRIAVATDATYVYVARMESGCPELPTDVLDVTLDGLLPIPSAQAAASAALAHWVE
jgi:hypothetical protein